MKNRILHTVKWSGNSHNSTAHNKDKKCVWRQKPGEHNANAHQENGKTDGVPPFLKTAPNAQNDSINRYDTSMVQTLVMLYATLSILSVFLGDVCMMIVDPRITLTGKGGTR